jgi:hypothetical protein
MTAVIQNQTPTEINFLADGQNSGFKVRVNIDLQISIFDLGKGLTGLSHTTVVKTWKRIKTEQPRVMAKCHNSKFPNSRQKTWVCDVDTAIELVMLWPGKAAVQFREQCARTIRRVLAGDETKEKKSLAEQLIHSLEIDGNPIVQMRKSDGFCNLTFMAKQAGKKTNDYMRMSSTKTFIEELKSNMENPENHILEKKEGRYGGTWGHPQVAIHMAHWIGFGDLVRDCLEKNGVKLIQKILET